MQEKELIKRIADRDSQGLPCYDLDLKKKQLRQEVDTFEAKKTHKDKMESQCRPKRTFKEKDWGQKKQSLSTLF